MAAQVPQGDGSMLPISGDCMSWTPEEQESLARRRKSSFSEFCRCDLFGQTFIVRATLGKSSMDRSSPSTLNGPKTSFSPVRETSLALPRPRLCLVYQADSPFVSTDAILLSDLFVIVPFAYRGKMDLIRLFRTLRSCDLSLSWFALGHATAAVQLSRLLGKPSAVIVGGWDVAAMPEIGYGAMRNASRRWKTRWALRRADAVLAVSEANRKEALQWVDRGISVVPLAIDIEFFSPGHTREDLVATGASVRNETTFLTKGLDVFFEVARGLPDVRFLLFGRHSSDWAERLRRIAPPNLEVGGWLSREELREVLRRARVYAQLSAHESFGMTLAEAMACGCVPVVSDRGALPEVVDGAGTVVPYGDPEAAARAIRGALETGDGLLARERIVTAFPRARRRELLASVLRGLVA